MKYQPHHMLVTGGAGFIGANFIRYLLTHEPQLSIINLDKLTYAGSLSHLENLPHPEQHHFIQGDIADSELVSQILQQHHIDTIVHFAAESHVDRSITAPHDFVATNVMGTAVLLEAARHYWLSIKGYSPSHCRFHHISTDEVYGSLMVGEAPFNENSIYQPRSPYAASKASSDHLVKAYYHTYGLPVTLSHCSNNYGPFQHAEKFIPTVIRACLNSQPIPIYGKGKNIRDWLYVEDHCRGILNIIQQGRLGETYDMGANNEWQNLQLAQFICQQMDRYCPQKKPHTSLIHFVTDRPGHDFRYAISFHKIQSELGWTPHESFMSGINKTIEFYLSKNQS